MKLRQGFTLMELLVVLLIIGILSTVALRTIDATRDRSLFDQTTKEMNKLVQAIVGNPDLTYDGRRVDFGYYGDMEQLPTALPDLIRNPGSAAWHGPYLKLTSAGDTVSYLFDGWGRVYTPNWLQGTIGSIGNGKFPMTVNIVDDIEQLDNNVIAGTITDRDGAAPGDSSVTRCSLKLYYNNPDAQGGVVFAPVLPAAGGYYEFSHTPAGGNWKVPIGIHKLVAKTPTESLIRYVTTVPRSKTIVDFKFTSSFWNRLRMSGSPIRPEGDSSSFMVHVVNAGSAEITIDSLSFLATSEPLYMRYFTIDGTPGVDYPIPVPQLGTGPGGTVRFQPPVTIAPNMTQAVEVYFLDFHADPTGQDLPANVKDKTFQFRFSDGSEITVKP